jgi:shikimate kinase
MEVREPLYRELADFVISTTRRRVPLVAASILAAFRREPLPEELP